jgi:hypothetical protein
VKACNLPLLAVTLAVVLLKLRQLPGRASSSHHQIRQATEEDGARTVPVRSGNEAVGPQNVIPRPLAGVHAANRDGSRSAGTGEGRRLSERRKRAAAALSVAEFVVCALAPVLLWFLWNLVAYGDLTATARKIAMLGWTANPLSQWFHHPIFTPRGAGIFWSELMASFWRGELVWFGARLAMPAADVFYWLSSLILVAWGVISLRRAGSDIQRRLGWFAFWSFASLVMFMGLLSVGFDFGECFYPSQARPYFTSGRLVSAALIPFLLLYVRGLDRALAWIKSERWRWGVLVALALLVTLSEIIANRAPFSSQYNLLHL